MKRAVLVLCAISLVLLFMQCRKPVRYDLIIENAKVFDVRTGKILDNKTILIGADTIAGVIESDEPVRTRKVIDANGRLVTPGNIETQAHLADDFNGKARIPEKIPEFISHFYHKRFSDTFLPFGVTTVLDIGQPEGWLPQTLTWSSEHQRRFFDLLIVGSTLTSIEEKSPDPLFTIVESPLAAKQKVVEYHQKGINHINICRLNEQELQAALKTADSLGMRAYGNIKPTDTALKFGLRNFAGIFTIPQSLFDDKADKLGFESGLKKSYGEKWESPSIYFLEMFRYISENKPDKLDTLLSKLAKSDVSFSTAIHSLAEPLGLTWFQNQNSSKPLNLSAKEKERCVENFKLYMKFVKKLYDVGIEIRIGTDCPSGGKALISEQLLLAEAGFSISDIIKISTINGAKALGIDSYCGSIEVGKKANLIIYDQNPFDNYKNFLSMKKVIKEGHFYRTIKRNPGAKISGI